MCNEKLSYFEENHPKMNIPYAKETSGSSKKFKIPRDPILKILEYAIGFMHGENVAKYLKALKIHYDGLGKSLLMCLDPENVAHRVTRDFLSCSLRPVRAGKKLKSNVV